jgi:hypothetical protein
VAGFRNMIFAADNNDEVAQSTHLDIAVSEDKHQREMFKKDIYQKQILMEGIIITKLGQIDGMQFRKRRLTAIGVIKSQ